MKAIFPFKTLLVILVSFLLFSCSKEEIIPEDVETNNFVWLSMNAYYKWQGEIEDLADTKFSTRDQLNEYLAGFETPDELFNSILHTSIDETSWITDDFNTIETAFDGIKLTTGMKVNGMYSKDTNEFFLYVYDVIEGSNAEIQGITRGMIITEINGVRVTEGNTEGLFENDSFSISIADYNEGNPIHNVGDPIVNLTKSDVLENPVKIAKVLTNGMGYLLYNNFTPDYDYDLNNAFNLFKTSGISNLIVDLRYNTGGSIETATYLASMITGQFKDEVFSKEIWNDKVMTNVINGNLTNYFTDQIVKDDTETPIHSLGLSTVYIIVSDATAGPAELLINGLEEHIDVKLIGSQTKGITEASMTLYDSDNYTKSGENFELSHTWALQPIVLEVHDSNNTNETEGHLVNQELLEDSGNLGELGEPVSDEVSGIIADPILASTVEYITNGSITPYEMTTPVSTQNLWNSNSIFLDYNKMYTEF